jgi:hypothetical protein
MSAPTIIDIYPANNAQGIPVGDKIVIVFDQEMDTDSINEGTFVVAAPDDDVLFTADLNPFEPPAFTQQDFLSSPYYGGRVKGEITFERRNLSGGIVDDSLLDETGDGTLWYTAAIFTPERPFSPNVQYTVLVAGDDDPDGEFDSGVLSRNVFDTSIEAGTNDGCTFCGSYTSDGQDEYFIRITSAGDTGEAEYQWWKGSDELVVYEGRTSTGRRELENGVCVVFGSDSVHTINDKWKVVVKPYELMENNYQFSFYTGNGSIIIPPSTSSVTGIETLATSTESPLQIVSITPKNYDTNLDIDTVNEIVVVFNKDLDPATITDETVKVIAESVNGDPDIPAAGEIATVLTVNGNTLTIQLS